MRAKPGAILSGRGGAMRLPGSRADYICLCGPDASHPALLQTQCLQLPFQRRTALLMIILGAIVQTELFCLCVRVCVTRQIAISVFKAAVPEESQIGRAHV